MLRNVITSGKRYDMVSMQDSVDGLLKEGVISEDAANSVLVNYRN